MQINSQMGLQAMKDEFVKLDGKGEIDKKVKEYLEQGFQQIQQSIKTKNSHDTRTIVIQVEDFIDKARSLPEELKEEKALVIDAAKKLQGTMEAIILFDSQEKLK